MAGSGPPRHRRCWDLGGVRCFRLAKAYGKHGAQALVSRRRGRPSNRCYPTALRAEVIGIIRERYADFGPTLAAEKLAELHGIHLSRETVRQWMIAVGLWKDRRSQRFITSVHRRSETAGFSLIPAPKDCAMLGQRVIMSHAR